MAKEKRLGRGLEALLGRVGGMDIPEQNVQQPLLSDTEPTHEVDADWMLQQRLAAQIPDKVEVMLIERNPYQPRQNFDEAELDSLAASLQTHGLLQPIVVRQVADPLGKPRYQIVAGERRYRAAMRAGWSEVPVHCINVDDREMVELALTENVQRKDLNAMEKAVSFANYLEMYGGTHDELAKRLELDRSTVTNLLRLLELPQTLQDAVRKGDLSQGHVRALLPLEEWEQTETAARIIAEGWSVRETERFVRQLIDDGPAEEHSEQWKLVDKDGKKRAIPPQSEQIVRLEEDFRMKLGGMKVKLTQTSEKGKGKLLISFASHAEFERIYALICRDTKKIG